MKIRIYLLSAYIFLNSSLLGWQFWSFVATFYSANAQIIATQYPLLMSDLQIYLLPLWIITVIVGFILYLQMRDQLPIHILSFRFHFFFVAGYCLFMAINLILYYLDATFYVYELLGVTLVLLLIYRGGLIFFRSDRPEFMHPTTMGTTVVMTGLAGLSLFNLLSGLSEQVEFQNTWLLILLFLNMSVLFARFRFLASFNPETKQAAKELLGKYIFLFGTRIILGIFTPIVFLIYSMFAEINDLKGISILILFGSLIDIYLIIITSHSEASTA